MGAHVPKGDRAGYVDAFRRSGLTQTKFCAQLNINPKTFVHWVQSSLEHKSEKLKAAPIFTDDPNVDSQPIFIPVKVMNTADCKQTDKGASSPASAIAAPEASSVVSLKIKGFCVDVPLNFVAQKNVNGVKSLIQILHQLPSDTSS